MPDTLVVQLEHALQSVYGRGLRVRDITRLSGGASRETFRFKVDSGTSTIQLILRRDFPGRPSPPGGMGLEAHVLGEAARAGLAVPQVIMSCDGTDCWETAGLVMEFVPGETIARRILRNPEFAAARQSLVRDCGQFLAGLHRIDPALISELPVADPLEVCRKSYNETGMDSPTFEYAFRWLSDHRPQRSAPVAIVHGDFRLGNLIVDERGLRAVLDWEGVHLGDPLEDLGWLGVKAWRFGATPPVAGLGSYDVLIAAYTAAEGRDVNPDDLAWWQIFGTLRWGVICMVQASFYLSGAVESVELAAIGRRVCEQEWDLLSSLRPDAIAASDVCQPEHGHPSIDLHGEPRAEVLVAAVRDFLRNEILPSTEGSLQFHTRVSANILEMIEREMTLGRAQLDYYSEALAELGATSTAEVAAGIRDRRWDQQSDQLIHFLATSVAEKLRVANPKYLLSSH